MRIGNRVLTSGIAAAALLSASLSTADVVQLDISADFNADLVVNDGSGMLDPTQDSVDRGTIPSGNFCFMTQSVADVAALAPLTPDGLPDDGFFPAGALHPDVQLAWRNDDDGLNAWRLPDPIASVGIRVNEAAAVEFHLFATSGDGSTDVLMTAIYSDGRGPDVPYTIPDWFDDPAFDAERYALANDRDRMQPGSGPGTMFDFEDSNDPAIFGLRLLVDPSRFLESVKIERTGASGVLNLFGATLVTDAPPEACCLNDGACAELGPGDCTFAGGTPQGSGTDCIATSCSQAEACCLRDGSCLDLLPDSCSAMGGSPSGPGTDCATESCPQFEACCFADGSCADLTAADCTMQGGSPLGPGTECPSSNCVSDQACCLDSGLCLDLRPAECAALDGEPLGDGTACAGTACTLATLPGWTPNGGSRSGEPLRVAKTGPADLSLSWGLGCSPDALDLTVHEGAIGSWYSHEAVICDTGGTLTEARLTPGPGGRYLLVAAVTATEEGSYGLDSTGAERPPSVGATCVPAQVLGCP